MKTKDAQFILGENKVVEMFLTGNSLDISRAVREILMQSKFYGISAENLARFLSAEVLWQNEVYRTYQEKILSGSPNLEIEKSASSLF